MYRSCHYGGSSTTEILTRWVRMTTVGDWGRDAVGLDSCLISIIGFAAAASLPYAGDVAVGDTRFGLWLGFPQLVPSPAGLG